MSGQGTHLYASSSIGFKSVTVKRPASTSKGTSFSTFTEALSAYQHHPPVHLVVTHNLAASAASRLDTSMAGVK